MNALRKSLVVGGTTLALLGAGAGAAWAGTPTPATPTRPGPAQPAVQGRPAPAPVVVIGRVIAVDARTLTVRETGGRTTVFRLTPRTRIVAAGRGVGVNRIRPGERIQVTADRDGAGPIATRVADLGR